MTEAKYGGSIEVQHREILRRALAERPRRPFKELAALIRAMIGVRPQTPAEELLHEAREER